MFSEASAASGENVKEVFERVVKSVITKVDQGDIPLHEVSAIKSIGGQGKPKSLLDVEEAGNGA